MLGLPGAWVRDVALGAEGMIVTVALRRKRPLGEPIAAAGTRPRSGQCLSARRRAPTPRARASRRSPSGSSPIPVVRDRIVQGALKLVLEPIYEADFKPCSYGFRPKRRAHDAVAEIRLLASTSYEWALDGDITACFDEISHSRAELKTAVFAYIEGFYNTRRRHSTLNHYSPIQYEALTATE